MDTHLSRFVSKLIDPRRLEPSEAGAIDVRQEQVGDASVLVLDGFYRDPGYVRDLALSLDYYRTNGLYPGFFAFASISAEPSLRLINMNGTQRQPPAEPLVFNRHYQKDFVFGIVTRASGELQPLQRQPHFATSATTPASYT